LPPVQPNEDIESESAHLVDFRLVAHSLGYARASVRRHALLVLAVGLGIFLAAVSSIILLPKSYVLHTKLLAQRNQALAVHGDNQADIPTRAAVETIMRRDNLVAIIGQTDLLHHWFDRRAPLAHLKDVIYQAITKPDTEAETTSWMADVLEKRMTVSSNEGVVDIVLDWPDATMGMRLLEAAQQNYLEARHATEITAIAEQVSILQNHAAAMRQDVDSAVDAIEKLRADRQAHPVAPVGPVGPVGRGAPKPVAAQAPATPRPSGPSGPDPELAQLKVMIEAKQRALNDLEEFRRRRLSELNAELAEKSAVYTENHPVMVDLRQTIASLSSESPQVQALRVELAQLQKDFAEKSAQALAESRVVPVIAGGSPAAPPPALPGSIIRIEQESSDDKDPALMYARQQLKDAMDKYSALRTQIENAQIDFDTAEAAFKYRYSVVEPPQFPKKATKPNTPLVVLAGLLGGLFVALFAAIAMDIRSGRFMQGWQVEQSLGLPMLTEIDYAALAEHKIE
jgi:uncharacterized protein involved in exopolysaccharide biosynthesis